MEVNPKDGEAWGRLAKAYKEAARLPKGWLRDDPAGIELVDLSEAAYERCLALLPKDALWHYGYADLLWSEYYWGTRISPTGDIEGLLPRALAELQTVLALDPDNSLAQDLLLEISLAVDGAVELDGDDYVFLALTATPLPPTPYGNPPTEANATATAAAVTTPTARAAAPEPCAENPVCGAGALIAPAACSGARPDAPAPGAITAPRPAAQPARSDLRAVPACTRPNKRQMARQRRDLRPLGFQLEFLSAFWMRHHRV